MPRHIHATRLLSAARRVEKALLTLELIYCCGSLTALLASALAARTRFPHPPATKIVACSERHGGQSNRLAMRVHSAVGNIGVRQTVKQVVGCAVFLDDDHYMLNLQIPAADGTAPGTERATSCNLSPT